MGPGAQVHSADLPSTRESVGGAFTANDLVIRDRRVDRLLQRHVPHFVQLAVLHGPRTLRVDDFLRRLVVDVGVLDRQRGVAIVIAARRRRSTSLPARRGNRKGRPHENRVQPPDGFAPTHRRPPDRLSCRPFGVICRTATGLRSKSRRTDTAPRANIGGRIVRTSRQSSGASAATERPIRRSSRWG